MTETFKSEFGINLKLLDKETTLTELIATNFSTLKIKSECKCGAHDKYIDRAITLFPYYLIVGL
jgi:hypothetical protein